MHPYRIAYVAAIALMAISCDRVNSPIVDHQARVSTSFRLADTTGVPSTAFHAGESIDMTCVVSNTSNVDVVYHQPSPAILFRIGRGDSTIASSTDGLAFPLVIVNGILTSGNSITDIWRGPNTRGRIPPITLPA
ncbi:MAG TPA: hypothetical protein VMF59_03595, partial [Bacteroidota bacterium]|nr:hypothetical protein [Bacteroidota bacterium]